MENRIMSNENLQDLYAAEQMPQEIQEKITALESAAQTMLIPKAQSNLQDSIERAYNAREISDDTRAYLSEHYLHDAFLPEHLAQQKIALFHGSMNAVGWPQLSKCREANDFGKCFYCTEEIELAKEWSCQQGKAGVVSGYILKLDDLSIVNLNSEQYHTLNWIGTLLEHRHPNNLDDDSEYARDYLIQNFAVDLTAADIIVGYRADDSYFQYATDFLQNRISLDKLSEAMRLGKLGEQVAIKSERAFRRLEFKRAYPTAQKYIGLYVQRDTRARETYRNSLRGQIRIPNKLTIERIIQEGIKNDDEILLRPVYRGRTKESWQHV